MLERTATSQSDELACRTLWLTSLIEPLLALAMGAMVLLIVLAILMPIIDMNQLIRSLSSAASARRSCGRRVP